jgi:CubicO group peptidase (beta-lactamase class C family)
MYSKALTLAAATLLLAAACTSLRDSGIRRSTPERQGMNSAHLALIDSTINASIQDGDIPGAVVGIVRNGALVYEKAFGNKAVYPEEEPMTVETMFDLASVSKCVGTTLSVMQLVEEGKLRLVDSVARYIPGFLPWVDPETGEKVPIRVQDLLTHSSGLDAYLPSVGDYLDEFGPGTPDSLLAVIATRISRNARPGTQQIYSCLNFITLQHILERITGERLCDYAQTHVFDALGLKHTCYLPIGQDNSKYPVEMIAPTERLANGGVLRGQVHDPMARLINLGNSGNAGVFSNVEDLALICAALLNDGSYNGRRILSPLTVKRMFEVPPANAPQVARALGWDTFYMEPYTCGDIFGVKNVRGHTGYTGTSLILDPDTNTAIIVLAHRVHPLDDGSSSRMRSTVSSIVAASIGR